MTTARITGTITVSCPSCGAEGYDIEIDDDANGAEISLPCDECSARICLDVDLRLHARAHTPEQHGG